MKKIYIVYYDNGQSSEDWEISVNKVFSTQESAIEYAKKQNDKRSKPFECSMSAEEYYMQDPSVIYTTYDRFYEDEENMWAMYCGEKYFVSSKELLD